MGAVLESSQTVVMAVLPGNLIASIVLGVSLKKLWQAINIMQFLIYFQLWSNFEISANAGKFLDYVGFIARGEFIPKEHFISKAMEKLNVTIPKDKAKLFTIFLGAVLLMVAVVATLIWLVVYVVRNQKSWLALQVISMKKQIFWNMILRTLIQMYLDFCIGSMMVIAAGFETRFSEISVHLFITMIMFVIPLMIVRILI